MQKLGIPLLAGLLVIAGGPGRSQDATPAARASTIGFSTSEVALDRVVRNKKGRQVKNLKPGDVEIYEDGVRQQVLSFRLVPGREEQRREAANPPAGWGAATFRA